MEDFSGDKYPKLSSLLRMYFNEDFDLWGDNVQEIIQCYKSENDFLEYQYVLNDVMNFEKDHPNDLDDAFKEAYKYQFNPEPWGYTTSSFFDELKRLLQE